MTTHILLGAGVLSWPRSERISDRYGMVFLKASPQEEDYVPLNQSASGKKGRLVVRVTETRPSDHVGFRGFYPTTPKVGEQFVLGEGTLFFHRHQEEMLCAGLQPDQWRASDWLDPKVLYRVHNQSVELSFELL